MTPRSRWLILGFAVLGLCFAGAATYVHYRLLTQPNYVSPCDISARFNCSSLYLSRFGSVAGVPVALAGVLFFGLVALLVGLSPARPGEADDATGTYVFALSTVGLAAVLYLAWASYVVLKTACILCIGTYVAVIGLFIVSGAAGGVPVMQLPGRIARDLSALGQRPMRLVMPLLFAAFVVAAGMYFPRESTTAAAATAPAPPSVSGSAASSAEQNFDTAWAQQPRVDLGIPADGAAVVIVKFNDWQCPSCKAAYYAYKPLLDQYAKTRPGAIKIVTKDYPLNSRCNFNVPSQMHAGACEAAAAVRLATDHGNADAMIEWLLSHQESLTPDTVQAQVKELLGVTDFAREYNRLLPDIKRDVADGGALHVEYTPTFYVNGVKAQAAGGAFLSAPYFEYAIEYELKKADK